METTLKAVTDSIDWLRKRFVFPDGLIVAILVSWVILGVGSATLESPSKRAMDLLFGAISESAYAIAKLSLYVVFDGIIVCFWLCARRIPRFSSDKAGVFFSSRYLPGLEAEIVQLREQVCAELKRRDLLNLIDIRILPANVRIADVHSAGNLLRKSLGTLIVWGPFEKTSHDGKPVTGFTRVNFTYSHPANISKNFHVQVAQSLIGRRWMFDGSNEVIEKSLVIENLTQVALNIIGMALLVKGYFGKAEAILGVLDVDLEVMRAHPNLPAHMANFCVGVRKNRVRAVGLQLKKEYMEVFKGPGIFHASPQELQKWMLKIEETIKLDKRDSGFFVMKAIIGFLQGNIGGSKQAILQAVKCAPRADPSPDFCLAFVSLFSGEFRKARSSYKKALAKKGAHSDALLTEIVEFIDQAIEGYPDKFQLHYALGLLNERRLERAVALREYENFVGKAKEDPYYSNFTTDAERAIVKLRAAD